MVSTALAAAVGDLNFLHGFVNEVFKKQYSIKLKLNTQPQTCTYTHKTIYKKYIKNKFVTID